MYWPSSSASVRSWSKAADASRRTWETKGASGMRATTINLRKRASSISVHGMVKSHKVFRYDPSQSQYALVRILDGWLVEESGDHLADGAQFPENPGSASRDAE